MALFQKRPTSNSNLPLYTLGQNKSVLVVGLGNPGEQYTNTRHNIGFACVDYLAESQDLGTWITKKDLHCQMVTGNIGDARVICMKPTTFMNQSGYSVQLVSQFYKISASDIVIIHDELDIPFGELRTRRGGGSAGHNGIKSVIEHIGEDFDRVRIGIQNEQSSKIDSADFVLAKFSKEELADQQHLVKEVASVVVERIASGSLHETTQKWLI